MGSRLQGKVAIVTGGGSRAEGIGNGRATAILFAREGARVLVLDQNLEAAAETVAMIDVPRVVRRCHSRPTSRHLKPVARPSISHCPLGDGWTSSTTTSASRERARSSKPTRRCGTTYGRSTPSR